MFIPFEYVKLLLLNSVTKSTIQVTTLHEQSAYKYYVPIKVLLSCKMLQVFT